MRRLGDKLFDALTAMIERNEIAEGERLPSETALAERFGVSRPTVRETLARLRDEGLIASRRGSGSYVQAFPQDRTTIHKPAFRVVDSFNQIKQCYEFRAAVEGESAFLAATARSEAQLAELRGAIRAIEHAG